VAHKIEFRVGSQTYVAAVEPRSDGYTVFLEDDRFPYFVTNAGVVWRDSRVFRGGSARLLCRTAVELAKEFLEERTGE